VAGSRAKLTEWARAAKRDAIAIYLAARDPRVPLAIKVFAALVAAYALSPIDLIPDFVPVVGYLDELILLPLAVWLIVRLLDPALVAELRASAERMAERPKSKWGVAIVVVLWLAAAGALLWAASAAWGRA
jgi:uncharacterized membrane protein YkvA (DUF1232 family)